MAAECWCAARTSNSPSVLMQSSTTTIVNSHSMECAGTEGICGGDAGAVPLSQDASASTLRQ